MVVGERKELEVGVRNLGTTWRRLLLRIDDGGVEGSNTAGDGVLKCLVSEVEVGHVGPGEMIMVVLPVLGVRSGVGGLGRLAVVDTDRGAALALRTEWMAKVVDAVSTPSPACSKV